MKTAFLIAALALVAVGALAKPDSVFVGSDEYIVTPAGYMRKDCVREVPNGASLEEFVELAEVHITHPDGTVEVHPYCDTENGARPIYFEQLGGPLPPDYDGWEEYTYVETKASYDKFLGYFSVPNMPQEDPQVLFIFTGLQNINWIPKATPLPTMPFDIIQPVLQYPASFGNEWSVKSWWVTLNAGAYYSQELPVPVGDKIFGNMTRVGPESYYIASVIQSTQQVTGLTYKNPRLKSQPWAYNTIECYGCQSCATYPTQPCKFTDLELYTDNKAVEFKWGANQFPAAKHFCHESTDIVDSATVTFNFA